MAYSYDELSGGAYRPNVSTASAKPKLTLEQILGDYFAPGFQQTQANKGNIQDTLMKRISSGPDFAKYRGELSTVATGLADELFSPGGEVEQAYSDAFGQTVESGFGTSSGGFERARGNILRGARDVVGRGIAQGALQLAGTAEQSRASDINALLGLHEGEAGRMEGLRESLFGGQATIEQLKLAQEQMGLNRELMRKAGKGRGLGSRTGGAAKGALAGASIGSAIPGFGTAAGAVIGGIGGFLF